MSKAVRRKNKSFKKLLKRMESKAPCVKCQPVVLFESPRTAEQSDLTVICGYCQRMRLVTIATLKESREARQVVFAIITSDPEVCVDTYALIENGEPVPTTLKCSCGSKSHVVLKAL
jgi:hypothetical protein